MEAGKRRMDEAMRGGRKMEDEEGNIEKEKKYRIDNWIINNK